MNRPMKQPSTWRTVWNWGYPILLGVVIAVVLRRYVVTAAIVPTTSMNPTIPAPCYVVVNKLSIEFSNPYRGEVVLFHFPDDPSQIFVKRLIGMPGDTVNITNDAVYVNGERLSEPYAVKPNQDGLGTYQVPAGHYFMLGDNRPVSDDSRFWKHHYVARSALVGQAVFVAFPLNKIKGISQ